MSIPLMIDSGAYSAWAKKEEIDLDAYIEFIYEVLIPNHPHAVYVNLDVINNGKLSYKNWQIMRKEGLKPLPVYHVSTDIKWLKRYLRHTDYIGLGAIVNLSTPKRIVSLDRIWNDFFIGSDKMPKVKVHGMGITSYSLMKRYPWYSIDSTSWLQHGIYGKVLIPKFQGGEWDYMASPLIIGFSSQSPTRKEKGKHFETLAPMERKLLLRFLKEENIPLGRSTLKKVKGKNGRTKIKEDVIEKGVSNEFRLRCYLNALFFSRFIKHLPYPRPFHQSRRRLVP